MVLTLPKHLQPSKQVVIDVMVRHGYVISQSTQYDLLLYPPGTTRDALRNGKTPLVGLTAGQIARIQETADTEEDVLLAVSSIIENGEIPDRIQGRIEKAVVTNNAEQDRRIKELEAQLAALTKMLEGPAPAAEEPKASKGKKAAPASDPA